MRALADVHRIIVDILFSIYFFDIFINKQSVIFEAQLRVIADGRFNYSFALKLFFWRMESAQIIAFQYLLSCRSFLWIKGQHFDN
jgi:hypothetical protein